MLTEAKPSEHHFLGLTNSDVNLNKMHQLYNIFRLPLFNASSLVLQGGLLRFYGISGYIIFILVGWE